MTFNVEKADYHKIGVYCITNLINNKIYIGSTTNSFRKRFNQHKCDFKKNKNGCQILCKAFEKYGINNFEFKIMCVTQKTDCLKMEQFYIDKGTDYNCAMIAGNLSGVKHSEESKLKCKKTRILNGQNKPIDKYSMSGIYIKSYDTIADAKRENKIICGGNIILAYRGDVFSAGGFRWAERGKKLLNGGFRNKRVRSDSIKVAIQKGNFYKEFDSMMLLAKFMRDNFNTKTTSANVCHCIKKNKLLHKHYVIDLSNTEKITKRELTKDDILYIYNSKEKERHLYNKFHTSRSTIQRIKRGDIYSEITNHKILTK